MRQRADPGSATPSSPTSSSSRSSRTRSNTPWHPGAGGGRVEVEARRDGDALVLTVADDGPGLAPGAARGGRGVGLRNTRERLARLYGDGHTFVLLDRDGGGLVAEVRLPFYDVPLFP